MSMQIIVDVVIGIALVGFLMYRQTTWQYFDTARIWRTPVILVGIGLVTLAQQSPGQPVSGLDIAIVAGELAVTVVIGLMMGRIARFRVAPVADDKGRTIQTRTGGLGAALWLVLIVVRIGGDVLGSVLGAHLIASTGIIIISIGVNRAARALVLDRQVLQGARARA